jgi:hypothetical protein
MIRHEKDGWNVYSEDGKKHLGGPYPTKEKAEERLREVEGHKNCVLRKHAVMIDVEAGDQNLVERPAPGLAPMAFRIWAAGENMSDEGPIYFTPMSAAALMLEQGERARRYASDFDHLSILPDRPATSGRASGWHSLAIRLDAAGEPELWAVDIEWCEDSKAGLEAKPPLWKYFSPAFHTDDDKQIVSYINFALCINPLTHGLPALAATTSPTTQTKAYKMKPAEAAAKLKAMADATDDPDTKAALSMAAAAFDDHKEPDGDEAKKDAEGEPDGDEPTKNADDGEDAKKNADDGKEAEKNAETGDEDKKPKAEAKHAKAHSVNLATENVKLNARLERLEVKELIADRPDLPEATRMWCLSESVDVVKRFLAKSAKKPAERGQLATQGKSGSALLQGTEREQLDAGMGMGALSARMPEKKEDGSFVLHCVRPTQLRAIRAQKGMA